METSKMKVYVLEECGFDYSNIFGVFDSREEAERAKKILYLSKIKDNVCGLSDFYISEYTIGELFSPKQKSWLTQW